MSEARAIIDVTPNVVRIPKGVASRLTRSGVNAAPNMGVNDREVGFLTVSQNLAILVIPLPVQYRLTSHSSVLPRYL